MVGRGEAVDPLSGGSERDAVSGLAGSDPQPDRQMSLAGAGRPEEDDVLFGGDEVQGAQVCELVAFEGALVVEVELFQCFSGREPSGADPALSAVGLAGGDFAL